MNDDRMTNALNDLIEAVAALGFERARDAIRAYGDEANPDAADWHAIFIDMVDTAVGVAADASGEEGNDQWLAFGEKPGQSVRWAWKGEPSADFAGLVLRSVHRLLGTDETKPAYVAALRMALPVMRRTAAEYLESVMVRHDPNSITPAEWDEIRPDLDAIVAAEACVGRQEDDSRERLWLDPILDTHARLRATEVGVRSPSQSVDRG